MTPKTFSLRTRTLDRVELKACVASWKSSSVNLVEAVVCSEMDPGTIIEGDYAYALSPRTNTGMPECTGKGNLSDSS